MLLNAIHGSKKNLKTQDLASYTATNQLTSSLGKTSSAGSATLFQPAPASLGKNSSAACGSSSELTSSLGKRAPVTAADVHDDLQESDIELDVSLDGNPNIHSLERKDAKRRRVRPVKENQSPRWFQEYEKSRSDERAKA